MESCLKASVPPVCLAPPLQAVALYAAIVGQTVEHSAFGFNPGVGHSQLVAAIETPLYCGPTPWLPSRAENPDDLTLLALAKLQALFASSLHAPNGTSDEILRAAYAYFPLTEPTPGEPPSDESFRVKACILNNGDGLWSYDVPSSDGVPPSIRARTRESAPVASIRNLVWADLQSRIARKRFIIANR